MPDAAGVQIQGLRELLRGLKIAAPEVLEQFKSDIGPVADAVASSARARVPRKSNKAADSIRTGVESKGAYVAGGKASVKYYGWLDFGSRNPNIGAPRSVGPWTRSGVGPKRGRFIYPAIDEHEARIERVGVTAAEKAIERAIT